MRFGTKLSQFPRLFLPALEFLLNSLFHTDLRHSEVCCSILLGVHLNES